MIPFVNVALVSSFACVVLYDLFCLRERTCHLSPHNVQDCEEGEIMEFTYHDLFWIWKYCT